MIKTTFYRTREDGANLYRTISDIGYIIQQVETGYEFEEAIDIENSGHTYIETNKMIEDDISAEDALTILLGGELNESTENT